MLPLGCESLSLLSNPDERGSLTELFRADWGVTPAPVQWNLWNCERDSLRGVQVHLHNWDYVIITAGKMDLGLVDLRKESPTFQRRCLIRLEAADLQAFRIPPGVGHGCYFPETASALVGLTELWSVGNYLGCFWNDPDLDLNWKTEDPRLSAQDRNAPPLREIMPALDAHDFKLQRYLQP